VERHENKAGSAGKRHHRGSRNLGLKRKRRQINLSKVVLSKALQMRSKIWEESEMAERDVSLWRDYRSSALDAAK